MANVKVTSPVTDFSGVGPGGIAFVKGVAEVDASNEGALAYFHAAGYGIGSDSPREPDTQAANFLPLGTELTTSGTRLRDAAVEPSELDYLAPINAGEAPAGSPEVIAPGLGGVSAERVNRRQNLKAATKGANS